VPPCSTGHPGSDGWPLPTAAVPCDARRQGHAAELASRTDPDDRASLLRRFTLVATAAGLYLV